MSLERDETKIRGIDLNQRFPLFDPDYVSSADSSWKDSKGQPMFVHWSHIRLRTGIFPDLEFALYTQPHPPSGVLERFSKAHPELTDHITGSDLMPTLRKEKLEALLLQRGLLPEDRDNFPFFLSIGSDAKEVDEIREFRAQRDYKTSFQSIQPELTRKLERFRLVVYLPWDEETHSKPDKKTLTQYGQISFYEFYFPDVGPLPNVMIFWQEVGDLILPMPRDLELLSTYEGKFIYE